jgi:hypothetical protein
MGHQLCDGTRAVLTDLVTERVSSDDDRLHPSGDWLGNF